MKIFIPNAKELNTQLDAQAFQALSPESQAVLDVLSQMSVDELAHFYKLKPEKAVVEADRWARLASKQAKTYPAWRLYDGLMYRYMTRRDLSDAEIAYLNKHVLITTGLYGIIGVFDLIAPHRLDFQGKLEVAGQSLKQFWRPHFDAAAQEEDVLISFLSAEFESVFSPSVQKRLLQVTFMENRAGQLKVHSTISKKARGRYVSAMAAEQVETIDQLKQLSVDGFAYRADLSSDGELVFVKDVH